MSITRTLAGLVGAAAVTTLVIGGSLASAQVTGSPSDPRAEFIVGNVPPGDCSRVGGSVIPDSAITFSIASGQLLTITAVDPAFTVIGIFVKGGDDTNLYVPGLRGLLAAPPWVNLISPLNNGNQIPAISHWFACGTPSTTTTTTTTTIPETTTTQAGSTTTEPGTTTTTTGGMTTTTIAGPTTTAARPASTLPHTGGGANTNVIGAAVLILLAGALATMVARRQASGSH